MMELGAPNVMAGNGIFANLWTLFIMYIRRGVIYRNSVVEISNFSQSDQSVKWVCFGGAEDVKTSKSASERSLRALELKICKAAGFQLSGTGPGSGRPVPERVWSLGAEDLAKSWKCSSREPVPRGQCDALDLCKLRGPVPEKRDRSPSEKCCGSPEATGPLQARPIPERVLAVKDRSRAGRDRFPNVGFSGSQRETGPLQGETGPSGRKLPRPGCCNIRFLRDLAGFCCNRGPVPEGPVSTGKTGCIERELCCRGRALLPRGELSGTGPMVGETGPRARSLPSLGSVVK
uniref:Uncharacterized protein n=1 Tax=Ananas comosus var. bracteatus TaxID=296719 RepID=A0A6V7PPG0_ANACO|nr:unnamed protein product [Ananas comosus var. bracteatus]